MANAKGVIVAQNVDDLHSDKNRLCKENSLTEKGNPVNGRGDSPNTHDMLTGSGTDGRALPGNLIQQVKTLLIEGEGVAPNLGLNMTPEAIRPFG